MRPSKSWTTILVSGAESISSTGWAEQLLVHHCGATANLPPGVMNFDMLASAVTQIPRERGISQHLRDGRCQSDRIAGPSQDPRPPAFNDFPEASDIRGDDRFSARHRLEREDACRLLDAWNRD